jgi:hypothetical protein
MFCEILHSVQDDRRNVRPVLEAIAHETANATRINVK